MTYPYMQRRRRMLLDMHIPAWDERFLASYEPAGLVRCYERAGVDAVMFYAASHVGLPYWRTQVTRAHPGLGGRDVVGELLELLHERDILACAYHSIAFDREAVEAHPEWSIVPARQGVEPPPVSAWPRHSVACMNKPGYLAYQQALLDELLAYPLDGLFLDMAFWPAVCVCEDCAGRWREEEHGGGLPARLDWADPAWARFQAARERWADEFSQTLIAHARTRAKLPVYQNFAVGLFDWSTGKPVRAYRNDSFLGADLYGGYDQQLFALKLMLAASDARPAEYMTTRAPNLRDHVSIKPEAQLRMQALGAISHGCATLFIDAIDPEGTVNPGVYDRVGEVYDRVREYEPLLGGEHLEDVGVYFSSAAMVELDENDTPLDRLQVHPAQAPPHIRAAIGACRALERAHVAVGVVTERQLDRLEEWPVLVVPDLVRIDSREVAALRRYVEAGGRLYASGWTSLLDVAGVRHDDFLLGELLGVRYEDPEDGEEVFLEPQEDLVRAAISPQSQVSWRLRAPGAPPDEPLSGGAVPRVRAAGGAAVLAGLRLPYNHPRYATYANRDWASVYSSPPWERPDAAAVVERDHGGGRTIYSAMPLERQQHDPAATALFHHLVVDRLLGSRRRLRAAIHPGVWVEVFHQPERSQLLVSIVNHCGEPPAPPVGGQIELTLPAGTSAAAARELPSGQPVHWQAAGPGTVALEVELEDFGTWSVEYRAEV